MTRLAYIPNRIIDHNGIADGATVHVYLTGTTTPINLYSDANMTVPFANPFTVVAGASFPAVFYDSSVNIKLTIVSASDGSIEEYDPYSPLSVSLSSPLVSVKTFGATGDGVTNDGAAFVTAIAYLKAQALNSGGGAYKGSQLLFVPAGHYYMGTTTLDINHTVMIVGEGSGRAPAPAYGCSHLRWADGVCGIRIQFPNTSGTTTVDGISHDGVGSCYIKNLSLQGGFTSTNSASHGIVVRAITYLDDVLVRGWSGTGVLSWTGNVLGTPYAGNTSVSRYTGVKVEGCLIGFDTRGTDSNVIKITNCEAYQCRQAGFIDNNGAGSNTYDTCHATYNGLSSTSMFTQVTYSGRHYAVIWGQEVAAATNAPSGTTADNTWWAHFEAGTADSTHPAWVNGMTGLTSGGDYVMLSNFPTVMINCYMEGGGFSQLGVGSLAVGGTNLGLSSMGGTCLVPEFDGLALKRFHSAATLHLDGTNDALGGFDVRETGGTVVTGSVSFSNQIGFIKASAANGLFIQTLSGGVGTTRAMITTNGVEVPASHGYYVNSQKVVGARGAAVTDGVAAAAAPTQAEFNALVTQFNALLARVRDHGLIA